jgi:hypothetical protein
VGRAALKVVAIRQGAVALDSSAGRNCNESNCMVIERSAVELDRNSRGLRTLGETNTLRFCGRRVGFSRPESARGPML